MLGFLNNLGPSELVVIAVVAVPIFGKNLPQAASKAYLQIRKLRTAMDDIRRESGIDKEIRDIERTVREAEWEARRATRLASIEHGPPREAPGAPPLPLPPPAAEAKPETPPVAEAPGQTESSGAAPEGAQGDGPTTGAS